MTTKDVRTTVKAALEAIAPFAAEGISAVIDNGESGEDSEQEQALREKRMVLVISPVVTSEGDARAAAGGRVRESLSWAIIVRRSKKCTIDQDDACDAVIRALLGLAKAGTIADLTLGADGTVRQLVKNDAGLLSTNILFTVPLTLQAP
jgi:hypothetical protein